MATQKDQGHDITIYEKMFENFHEVVFIKDPSLRFVYANPAFLKTMKYPNLEFIIGKTAQDLFPDFASIYHEHDFDTLNGQFYFQVEDCHTYQREKCVGLIQKSLIKDTNKNTKGIICRSRIFFDKNLYQLNLAIKSLNGSPVKIKRANCYHPCNRYLLSPREEECLYYFLHGKSAKSIAKILKLSPRTVEEYINNIKIKWDCHYKDDVFEKANQYGYLDVIPISQFKFIKDIFA